MSTVTLAELPGRPCPIAAALELVGERWALLVIRELALGNTRFGDIVRGTGAPRDRIAARLKALEEAGVISRSAYQSAPPRFDYRLTESGRALLPVLDALLRVGQRPRRQRRRSRPRPAPANPTVARPEDTRRTDRNSMTAELADTTSRAGWGRRRSKTVTWHEPGPTTATGLSMAGVDYLQAIVAGELPPPPIAGLMEFEMIEAEAGLVVFTCRPDESAYNPIGAVHGGLVCTLLDSVAGCALHSVLPQGKGYTSVEIKVSYLKAVRLDSGLLTATGTVVKSGARVGFTEGIVTDESGATVATASSTLLIFDL